MFVPYVALVIVHILFLASIQKDAYNEKPFPFRKIQTKTAHRR